MGVPGCTSQSMPACPALCQLDIRFWAVAGKGSPSFSPSFKPSAMSATSFGRRRPAGVAMRPPSGPSGAIMAYPHRYVHTRRVPAAYPKPSGAVGLPRTAARAPARMDIVECGGPGRRDGPSCQVEKELCVETIRTMVGQRTGAAGAAAGRVCGARGWGRTLRHAPTSSRGRPSHAHAQGRAGPGTRIGAAPHPGNPHRTGHRVGGESAGRARPGPRGPGPGAAGRGVARDGHQRGPPMAARGAGTRDPLDLRGPHRHSARGAGDAHRLGRGGRHRGAHGAGLPGRRPLAQPGL